MDERGLDWDPVEYLMRAYNPNELRGPHTGEWTKNPVAGLIGSAAAAAATGPPKAGELPTRDLADAVGKLQAQFEAKSRELETQHRAELGKALAEMRAEQDRLHDLDKRVTETRTAAEQKRSEIIKVVVNVLALAAVAALIIATAGMAIPPLAAAGVAVGPLAGGEIVHAIHASREARAKIGTAGELPAAAKGVTGRDRTVRA